MSKIKTVGHICIDSGQMLLDDPCYVDLRGILNDTYCLDNMGVMCQSGWGDVVYPVENEVFSDSRIKCTNISCGTTALPVHRRTNRLDQESLEKTRDDFHAILSAEEELEASSEEDAAEEYETDEEIEDLIEKVVNHLNLIEKHFCVRLSLNKFIIDAVEEKLVKIKEALHERLHEC